MCTGRAILVARMLGDLIINGLPGTIRRRNVKSVSLYLCASVVVLTGCVAPHVQHPMRAIWVTRFDYKTADDVTAIIENCAAAGFNAVLFQVRGNGTAFYKSSFEPWADELSGAAPGFDPLELACGAAHERRIELHAWVNVMPAWRGTRPPANPEQLYNKHPEWFWYDQNGRRQALNSFYVSLNPCLPEVREYLVDVFHDLVSRYDVDGLHLDYIRFPNEPPAIPRGSAADYPRDERTLALFSQDTDRLPDDDPVAWNQWRTGQVTRLVADIHHMLRRSRPQVVLSASVGPVRESALKHFQDGRRWIDEALIDVAFVMNYTDTPETFAQRLEPWLARQPRVPVIPGLWFGSTKDRSVEEGAVAVKGQIEIACAQAGSFCVFAYSSLFDGADEGELTRQSEEQRRVRQIRQEILLPFLHALAQQVN
jgi:uncharacterized lipoprotein YddW (UPF0748 family)